MLFARRRGVPSGKKAGQHVLGDFGAPRIIRLCADLVAILSAFAFAFWLHHLPLSFGFAEEVGGLERLPAFVLVYATVVVATFQVLGLYRPSASVLNLWEVATTLRGLFVSSSLVVFAAYGFATGELPRLVIAVGVVVSAALILLERRLVAAVLRTRQLKGVIGKRVLIVGAGPTGRLLMKRLIDAPHESRTVVGFLDGSSPIGSTVTCTTDQTTHAVIRRSVLGRPEDLTHVAGVFEADEVLVDAASVGEGSIPQLLEMSESAGLRFGLSPHLGELRAERLVLEPISTIPVLYPRRRDAGTIYRILNRVIDFGLSSVLLLASSPLWLAVAALIKLDSPGPVLFSQDRVGAGGRKFRMFKFRTMREDADAYAASPRGDSDPRITRVGRFLRRGGLDEVPQLLNVLRGDMAVVGPRPEMEFIVAGYTAYERRRLQVKPGITGIWQISPDRHGQIHQNVEYDLYYIDHQSLLLDALILFETAVRTLEMLVKGALGPKPSRGDVYAMPSDFELRTAVAAAGPVVESGTLVLEHGGPWRSGYLLVALEQRSAEKGRPDSWDPVSKAAYAISCRWPVKLVAAESNRTRINRILESARSRMGSGQARLAYVDPQNEWEVRAHIASAALLITDVPEFADWAMEMGVSSYTYPSGERRLVESDIAPRAVEELDRWLRSPTCAREVPHLTLISAGSAQDD